MLVMHEPMNTSSILSPATCDSSLASSGSFGQQRIGSLISSRLISMISAYSASLSARISTGLAIHFPCCRYGVTGYGHRRSRLRSSTSTASNVRTQVLSDRSFAQRDRTSCGRALGRRIRQFERLFNGQLLQPSISRMRPLKAFFLPFFSTVSRPSESRWNCMHQITQVMPGCILPLKRTRMDSGISSGITPVAAPNATKPEPAGKEIPIGEAGVASRHQYQRYLATTCGSASCG